MADLPPGREVRVLDDVCDRTLPALYRHAQVFVYPSFAEGFGMPPLEAMASGVPVITTRSTAIPEVVGEAGILVPLCDIEALQIALERLVGNPALRAELATAGLARAECFTWRRSAEVLAQRYRAYFGVRA